MAKGRKEWRWGIWGPCPFLLKVRAGEEGAQGLSRPPHLVNFLLQVVTLVTSFWKPSLNFLSRAGAVIGSPGIWTQGGYGLRSDLASGFLNSLTAIPHPPWGLELRECVLSEPVTMKDYSSQGSLGVGYVAR